MRPAILLALLILAGCGGSPVGGDCSLPPDPAFAGQYAAAFTPAKGAVGAREFRLSVLADGRVGGSARDPATGGAFVAEVTGSVLNNPAGCGTDETLLGLTYTLPGGVSEHLDARKPITGSIARGFRAVRTGSDATTTAGTLALERAVPTGG